MISEDARDLIIRYVFDLMDNEPTSRSAMIDWYERTKKVRALIQEDTGELKVPHALWHYLDDADIRMKDHRYAESQILQIKEALRAWKS